MTKHSTVQQSKLFRTSDLIALQYFLLKSFCSPLKTIVLSCPHRFPMKVNLHAIFLCSIIKLFFYGGHCECPQKYKMAPSELDADRQFSLPRPPCDRSTRIFCLVFAV